MNVIHCVESGKLNMCELKPCSICGEPSKVFTLTDGQGIKHYGIACNGGHNPKEFYDTEAEAILAWNCKVTSSFACKK